MGRYLTALDEELLNEPKSDFMPAMQECCICGEVHEEETMSHDLQYFYCRDCARGHMCLWCGAYADEPIKGTDPNDSFCGEECRQISES